MLFRYQGSIVSRRKMHSCSRWFFCAIGQGLRTQSIVLQRRVLAHAGAGAPTAGLDASWLRDLEWVQHALCLQAVAPADAGERVPDGAEDGAAQLPSGAGATACNDR